MPHLVLLLLTGVLFAAGPICAAAGEGYNPPEAKPQFRRPAAAAWLDGGRWLAVANRNGTVSLIRAETLELERELAVGRRLSDVAALPDGRHLLVCDDARHELIALRKDADGLRPIAKVRVAASPVDLAVSGDGRRGFVASLWSRRVTVVDLSVLANGEPPAALPIVHSVLLPFAPGRLLALPGGKLLAADAFGGNLALIDPQREQVSQRGPIEGVREIPGHNIRGLALGPQGDHVFVSQQRLAEDVPATVEAVTSGRLLRNQVRIMPLNRLLDPRADLQEASRVIALDAPGRGAGDPAGLAVLDDGRLLVALSGVDDMAIAAADGSRAERLAVGRRPRAVLRDSTGRQAFVLNTLEETVSVIDLAAMRVIGTIPLGPRAEPGPIERGESLFYDARLSHDGWLSCHSCHTDGHSNGLLADTLGDGSYGTPKQVLSLLGTGMTDPWAWNGQMKELHTQVEKSIETTMHGKARPAQIGDLVAYLHSLDPAPPLDPKADSDADRQSLDRGRALFRSRGCAACHIPPLTYTSHGTVDVGLRDEAGQTLFNPPSLLGVSQRAQFLHDGRAATLEEVFSDHAHQVEEGLTEEELRDLVRFLRSL